MRPIPTSSRRHRSGAYSPTSPTPTRRTGRARSTSSCAASPSTTISKAPSVAAPSPSVRRASSWNATRSMSRPHSRCSVNTRDRRTGSSSTLPRRWSTATACCRSSHTRPRRLTGRADKAGGSRQVGGLCRCTRACDPLPRRTERRPTSTVDARGRRVDVKARGRRQPRERNRRQSRRKAEAL
jgi:hypothetical protein